METYDTGHQDIAEARPASFLPEGKTVEEIAADALVIFKEMQGRTLPWNLESTPSSVSRMPRYRPRITGR
ncbi:MAG: hypothetical protein WC498_02265 [Candidatus Saccharimonadales bacterium]